MPENLYNYAGGVFPKTVDAAIVPDIDSSFTSVSYNGSRLSVKTAQACGIKTLSSSRASSKQGMAIYGNMMVTVAADNGTHYIYSIGDNFSLSQLATFSVSLGHANAAQFAPTVASGETYPYLYVSGTSGECHVLRIAADYSVTKLQTISSSAGQLLIGDDGYIWGSGRDGTTVPRKFTKYRKVAVAEGDITLGDDDIIESWTTDKIYSTSNVTAQGWSVKFGKVWFCYGASGSGQKRGVDVYDTATHRRVAELDFSSYSTLEYEDVDFWNNSMIIATYSGTLYMVKF